jgi:hypothetical protein
MRSSLIPHSTSLHGVVGSYFSAVISRWFEMASSDVGGLLYAVLAS